MWAHLDQRTVIKLRHALMKLIKLYYDDQTAWISIQCSMGGQSIVTSSGRAKLNKIAIAFGADVLRKSLWCSRIEYNCYQLDFHDIFEVAQGECKCHTY